MKQFIPNHNLHLISALITSAPLWAFSEVDLLTGALFKESTDPALPHKARSRRNYSSRSLHRGIFGFGWCSDLERKIEISDTQITYYDCNREQGEGFFISDHGDFNNARKTEKIVITSRGYKYFSNNNHIQTFDNKGRLSEIVTPAGLALIQYSSNGPIEKVSINKKVVSTWSWNDDHSKVKAIYAADEAHSEYFYEDSDLIAVKTSVDKKNEAYSYDRQHNMLSTSDETYEYNDLLDVVVTVKKSNFCNEKYSYNSESPQSQKTIVTIKCKNQGQKRKSVLFRFKSSGEGAYNRSITQIELKQENRIQVYQFSNSLKIAQQKNYDRRALAKTRIGAESE